MRSADGPQWVIREDAGVAAIIVLYLRQMLGVTEPVALPGLRGLPSAQTPADDDLAAQWLMLWQMTVEPFTHTSPVPLDLIDGFDTLIALPVEGADDLRVAIEPHAEAALSFARGASERYTRRDASRTGTSYRAYASAIAVHERQVGRRAHSFELNVQVLPLTQRGLWWIGANTIAVTDELRGDAVAFDTAIHPVIAELA